MTRVYHPYTLWEEVAAGMWGEVGDPAVHLERAVEFTGDHALYGSYMERVAREWRYSCENALTDPHLNRRAWIGHAACAMAIGCPEDITRRAWGRLTDEQRLLANEQAARAIQLWENAQIQGRGVQQDLGGEVLRRRYT